MLTGGLENLVDLAQSFGAGEHVAFSPAHAELLFVGSLGVAVTDLRGRFLASCWMRERPVIVGPESRVLASQRTPDGWQFLYRETDGLTNCRLKADELEKTFVRLAGEDTAGAAWSPCGRYLALASSDGGIEVVNASDGARVMRKGLDIRNVCEPPRSHRLAGWSADGRKIVSVVTLLEVTLTVVWDAFQGDVITLFQLS